MGQFRVKHLGQFSVKQVGQFSVKQVGQFRVKQVGQYSVKSTLIAAQVPSNLWYDLIGKPTISYAILDSLTSKAH